MPAQIVRLAADDLDRLVGIPEAAARLDIGTTTAYRMIAEKSFPVSVLEVNGRKRVSLRELVEFMSRPHVDVKAS